MNHKSSHDARHDRDARVRRTRHALRAALVELLAEPGAAVAELTAQRVVARAGVGYATFFRHYPTLEALLDDVASTLLDDIVARLEPLAVAGRWPEMTGALVAAVSAHRATVHAILVGGGERPRRAATALALARTERLAGVFAPELPLALAVSHAVNSAINTLAWWLATEPPVPPEILASLLTRLVLRPVLAGPGTGRASVV